MGCFEILKKKEQIPEVMSFYSKVQEVLCNMYKRQDWASINFTFIIVPIIHYLEHNNFISGDLSNAIIYNNQESKTKEKTCTR